MIVWNVRGVEQAKKEITNKSGRVLVNSIIGIYPFFSSREIPLSPTVTRKKVMAREGS